jgi:deoxyadenosine/deoxycytidine kinase
VIPSDFTPRAAPPRPKGGIAVVGPCAAGKTTLVLGLRRHGYFARQIVQEHSYVPDMWRRLARPDVLIYLDASYPTCTRRKQLDWLPHEHEEQLRRLAHARQNCDVYVATDEQSPEDVLHAVLQAIGADDH